MIRKDAGRALKIFALITTAGLFVVLLAGFLVTDTHSALGCGRQWPLCHGRLVPLFTLHSLIEFSHRVLSGLVGLMVGILGLWAWIKYRHDLLIKILAGVGIGFVIVQSLLGAAAVLWPESPPILALHFGFALIAFGGVALLMIALWQSGQSEPQRSSAPTRVRQFAWLVLIYLVALVYLGALVSHTANQPGCTGWPLCNGVLLPRFHDAVAVQYFHRLAAFVSLILFFGLHRLTLPMKKTATTIYRAAAIALVLVFGQALSGALLVFSHDSLPANMLHVALVSLLFADTASVALLCTFSRAPEAAAQGGVPAAT